MSAKRAFFSVFQKLVVFCCAMFFGFANAFSANLPSGYTELKYIESTGTQYIDTGVIPTKDSIKIRFEALVTTSNNNFPFGVYGDGLFNINLYRTSTPNYRILGFSKQFDIAPADMRDRHIYEISKDGCYFDNTLLEVPTTSTTLVGNTKKLAIFGKYNSAGTDVDYPLHGKIFFFQIYEERVLVRNFIPAKRTSDSVIGMYDTVTGQFFTNAGTGEFIAGPEVSIRIATTAYNTAQFNPVVTDLNSTIATIRDIVTKTINQTAAIASLQADKQTRPEDACPAGKKCLLVETEENGVIVPHWFPIIEDVD